MPTNPSYREIELTRGKVTLVDAEDFDWLSQWNWHAQYVRKRNIWYAARHVGTNHNLTMHRQILGLTGRFNFGDHANGDGLDNRRFNLRHSDPITNQRNQKKHADSTNPYKGIWHDRGGRWYARVSVNGRRICSSAHATPEEAYVTWCSMALEHYGEFARLV